MTSAVQARIGDEVFAERYRYAPGPAVELPAHAHEALQLNLSLGAAGGVRYRGAYHVVPAGQVAVVLPGEPHTPRDPGERRGWSTHLTLYVEPGVLHRAAAEHGLRGTPTFPVALADDRLAAEYARVQADPDPLHLQTRFVEVLALLLRHAGPVPTPATDAPGVVRAREYLRAHHDRAVSLADLTAVSGLSPFHLTRAYRARFGMPPHAHQVLLRVEHAKRLLARGEPATAVAHRVGFFDVAHLTRHFRRHVGVTPGAYARRSLVKFD